MKNIDLKMLISESLASVYGIWSDGQTAIIVPFGHIWPFVSFFTVQNYHFLQIVHTARIKVLREMKLFFLLPVSREPLALWPGSWRSKGCTWSSCGASPTTSTSTTPTLGLAWFNWPQSEIIMSMMKSQCGHHQCHHWSDHHCHQSHH